jgi:YbbR domain-containing protein
MLRWLTTNLRTFLLAFALALAIWVTAVTATDPDKTQVYPNPILIEFIGQDPALIITGTIPQQVEVTLRAPTSIWERLISDPTSVRAVVDLSGLGAGTHTVEIQLQVATRPVRVISLSPKTFDLVLEQLVTRNLPIELEISGEAATGFQVGEIVTDPLEVVISGPESLVNQVAHVIAEMDISAARQTIEAALPLLVVDSNGVVLTGVSIHPDTVQVSLPITQQSGYRDLAVKVVTVGRPASGYRPTSVSAFPAIVTVYSENVSLIASLPGYVETMALDLSGVSDDIETNLALNLPAGVTVIGDPTVLVQVGIAPLEGSLTISYRPVEIIGLETGLTAQVSPTTVDVILSGPLPVLDSLFVSDVRVRLDLTGLAAGTYQLTPTVVIAKQGVTVESILPGTVEVIITNPLTPTPTP